VEAINIAAEAMTNLNTNFYNLSDDDLSDFNSILDALKTNKELWESYDPAPKARVNKF